MAEMGNLEKMEAARQLLRSSLENSKQLAASIDQTGSRLQRMNQRFPSLEAEARSFCMCKTTHVTVLNQIDCVIGPAVAVLRVYDAVRELESSLLLSDPKANLSSYLSVVKRFEEALRFLANNSALAIQWLKEIHEMLESNGVRSYKSFLYAKRALRILEQLHAMEEDARLNGGPLAVALEKIECEFSSLLTENDELLPMPVSVIHKLKLIIERLNANDQLENSTSLFVDVRVSNVRRRLQVLDLDYLGVETETLDYDNIESYITTWGKQLEFAVKHVYEHEFKLSNEVFEKIGSDCFAKIAINSGIIISFLQFGNKVTAMKKDPIKLLKMLDIFKVLNNLRLDFNRLFGAQSCLNVQTVTKDLIEKVVKGACDIFWELPVQVGLQRQFHPPSDGSVPRLVLFVTNYCNKLLGGDYRPVLTQVLAINQRWKEEKYEESLLSNQFCIIMKEIGLNLDSWSKAYADISLSYLFMMNNHCHFCNLRGTKLGEMMGDSWLGAHEQYKDYYAALYLRESWGKLLPLLSQKGLISLSMDRDSNNQDLDKKRLKDFTEAFEESYEKHANWVISDESLRQKVCQLLVQAVVPVYRSYIQKYRVLVEEDANAGKYVKHTAQSLETMLSSLFQPKLNKYCTNKRARLIGKIKNVVSNQLRSTLTAM
ncbi:hypothetical protein UlMin_041943 [Ulmus minor]